MHSLIVSNPCPFTDKEDDNDVDDDYDDDDDDDVVRALTNGQEVAKEVLQPPPLRTKWHIHLDVEVAFCAFDMVKCNCKIPQNALT